ncbi:hypothetical protein C8R47DRAFT_1203848 [Mycena vitilis]|nr:hypothetical protein C8R47DRAFT_1203848 [Mycena vitilis]
MSPIFRTMFSIPQPTTASAVPIVDLQENSSSLDKALRFFYPGTEQIVATLQDLHEIIETLISKYLRHAVPRPDGQNASQNLHRGQPHWCLRCRVLIPLGGCGEDRMVAAECLKLPLRVHDSDLEAPPELKYLTAGAYFNLLRYHARCATAAKRTTENLSWVQNPELYCAPCPGTNCLLYMGPIEVRRLPGLQYRTMRYWLVGHFIETMGSKLANTPRINLRSDVEFSWAMHTAGSCNAQCRDTAIDTLNAFILVWETQISEELAQVNGSSDHSSLPFIPGCSVYYIRSKHAGLPSQFKGAPFNSPKQSGYRLGSGHSGLTFVG